MAFRCGHSAFRVPLRDSIQAWSVGVEGAPEVLGDGDQGQELAGVRRDHLRPVVRDREQDRPGLLPGAGVSVGVRVDEPGVGPEGVGAVQGGLEQALGVQGLLETEPDLGVGLLRRDDVGEPLAGDEVLDDEHGHPAPGEVGVGVGPGRPACLAAGGFPRPALRTGRAALTASGSPRVPVGYAAAVGTLAQGVGMVCPRQR
jgi:hypothetical protein